MGSYCSECRARDSNKTVSEVVADMLRFGLRDVNTSSSSSSSSSSSNVVEKGPSLAKDETRKEEGDVQIKMISLEEMGARLALSVASQLADKVLAGVCTLKPTEVEKPCEKKGNNAVSFFLGVLTAVGVSKARECCKKRRQKEVASKQKEVLKDREVSVKESREIGVQSPCTYDRVLDKFQYLGSEKLRKINRFD